MARKYGVSLDLQKNELQNARMQNLAGAPASPVTGLMYYDTGTSILYFYDGTTWQSTKASAGYTPTFGAVTSATLFGQAASNGVATTETRSDHTHGTPALGTTSTTAAAGNDARLSDSRAPNGAAGGSLTGTYPSPTIAALAITDSMVATANKDGLVGVASLRTLGIAALKAMPGDTRLDQITVPTTSVSLNSNKIINLLDPTLAQDAVTKNYVDNAVAGLTWKSAARVLATTNIVIATPGTTIDAVTMAVNDRVVLTGETTTSQNGLYVYNGSAVPMTRALDANSSAELVGMAVFIAEGTSADTAWTLTTNAPITVDTTALTYAQFTGAASFLAGNGLLRTGNTVDVVPLVGGGIVVAADSVSIDTALTARWKTFQLTGSTTSYVVNHALGNQWVSVQVMSNAAPFDTVECDEERTDLNNVTIRFTTAPASNAYRVVIIG